MLEVCKQLFTQWNDSGVGYCHWKSNEHLMEGLDGETDLDVFVRPSDKSLAESLLSQTGYIECITQKEHRYPNVFEWIGFDSGTGHLVHVHLHYQIITGTKYCKEYIFPCDDLIISTRVVDPDTNVYITDPNLEIIILYCRIALKSSNKKHIKPDKSSIREIDYLRPRIDKDKVLLYCKQQIKGLGEGLFQLIIKEELDEAGWYRVYKMAEKWLRPYRKYSKIHVFLRFNYYKTRNIFILVANRKLGRCIINRKTFPTCNLSICLLGQDGSGKSTVTKELEKWLNWKIEAHRFYLGSGDHYNGLLKRFLSKAVKIKHRNDVKKTDASDQTIYPKINKKKKKNIKNFFTAILVSKNHLNVARRAYKEVKKAEKYRQHGGIPLFDRFPQTQFDGIYDGPKIRSYYIETGLNFALVRLMAKREQMCVEKIQHYQPALVFKLLLSPEESIHRKPFENLMNVSRKHEITKQLQFPKSKVIIIDAEQDYEKEILFIKNEIWNMIQGK